MPVVRSKKYTQLLKKRAESRRPNKMDLSLSIKDFYEKRNKILFIRSVGGLGDIMIHRMIFEDVKKLIPSAEIHFACPSKYHDAVTDHPFVDKVIESKEIDKSPYIISYNTTTACGRAEMKLAPFSGPHRSDIWADHCGLKLTCHNMHINLTEEEKAEGGNIIESVRDREGPKVLVSPISAMENKNLQPSQLVELFKGLHDRGLFPYGIHQVPIAALVENDMPCLHETTIRQWLAIIDQSDYVISVDTATFHAAGGMNKPLVGIFTFVNADAYAQHYPNTEVIQGPCPVGHKGCYNWGTCPYKENPKPCLTEITPKMILDKMDLILEKYPI